MSLIQEKANEAALDVKVDSTGATLDPISTALLIVSIIVEVVKLVKGCKKTPAEAAEAFSSPGILQHLYLKLVVYRTLRAAGKAALTGQVQDALYKVGEGCSEADLQTMYVESEGLKGGLTR